MAITRIATRLGDGVKSLLEYRHLPALLALGAMLLMLPALKTGLFADDWVQWSVEMRPGQLPARLRAAGTQADSGTLRTVLNDLFPGLSHDPAGLAQAKRYGILPWWTISDVRFNLWRPVTAFTHWLDYRLFPDSPALMHLENNAWFAAVVLLVAVIYRKFMAPGPAAGLAAVMFLLDCNTFFPVMFVANRGFIIALCFGLLCLYQQHRWRAGQSRSGCVLAMLFLALAVLANEGGASTLAFILAYALVLDPGSWRNRAGSVLPALLVIVLWRIAYKLGGFGLWHVGLYIDPVTEPLAFARTLIPRDIALLGGQLTSVPPDLLWVVKPALYPAVIAAYGAVAAVVLALVFPWVRRDKIAAFWLAVMLLAAIPASTVSPLSKNLGFVAVGAYGLIASFIAAWVGRSSQLPAGRGWRIAAGITCGLLLLIHVPGALAGRALTLAVAGGHFNWFTTVHRAADATDKNMIAVNAPCAMILSYGPYAKAYYHQPPPPTLRALVPGCTRLEVERTDDRTLVIRSRTNSLFSCDDVGAFHIAYAFSAANMAIGHPHCRTGDHYELTGVTVDVLAADARAEATAVAFRFDRPLEAPDLYWMQFRWATFSYEPFAVPAIGQRVTLDGPRR
jgi:hypothetical protein